MRLCINSPAKACLVLPDSQSILVLQRLVQGTDHQFAGFSCSNRSADSQQHGVHPKSGTVQHCEDILTRAEADQKGHGHVRQTKICLICQPERPMAGLHLEGVPQQHCYSSTQGRLSPTCRTRFGENLRPPEQHSSAAPLQQCSERHDAQQPT